MRGIWNTLGLGAAMKTARVRYHIAKISLILPICLFYPSTYAIDCSSAEGDAILWQMLLINSLKECIPESIDSKACRKAYNMSMYVIHEDFFETYDLCEKAGLSDLSERYVTSMSQLVGLQRLFVKKLNENSELTKKMLESLDD
jgi:hypothetical protein